jgi:hypothetical protein
MVYISYGTKIVQKAEGIAADFCPICRRASVVLVSQVRAKEHVYNISLGSGSLVGRMVRCKTCGGEWELNASTIEAVVPPTSDMDLNALIAATYPRFQTMNADRFALEAVIARDPSKLDATTRQRLIAEPFFILDRLVLSDDRQPFTLPKTLGGLCVLGIVISMVAAITFGVSDNSAAAGMWTWVAMGFGGMSLYLNGPGKRHFMTSTVYQRLASCLAPLHPTAAELEQVVASIRGSSRCATRTNVKRLEQVLASGQSTATKAEDIPDASP